MIQSGSPEKSDVDTCKLVKKNFDDGAEWLRGYHEDFEDNYRFLFKFEHYDDTNANTRDRRRAKPKGRQLAGKHRHIVAQTVADLMVGISTHPVDEMMDPIASEFVRWFMTYEMADPSKKWPIKLYRAVSLAAGAGMGCLSLETRFDLGPYPVVMPRNDDPRSWVWAPGWIDIDDVTCPWAAREGWMRRQDVERMGQMGWENTEDMRGTTSTEVEYQANRPHPLKPIRWIGDTGPSPSMILDQSWVRVIECWYRMDYAAESRGGSERALSPTDRFMFCPGCQYEDHSQEGQSLPDVGPPCPDCAKNGIMTPLFRTDFVRDMEHWLKYPEGKRKVICAPDEPGGPRVFYDKPWPYDINGKAPRNVPVCMLHRYELPLEPWAASDTDWDWSYQVVANALDRRAYESVSRTGGVVVVGGDGLYSSDGKRPFEFNDRPLSIARWRGMGEPMLQFFQPRGLLSDILPYMQNFEQRLRADQGVTDFGITRENSKDIAASTLQQMSQLGEIPQKDFTARCSWALAPFLGVWYDHKRAVMTERQMVGLRGPEGLDMFALLRGEELPNADVMIEIDSSWDQFDAERSKAVMEMMQFPPQTWPLLAKAGRIPPSFMRDASRLMMLSPGALTAGQPQAGGQSNGPSQHAKPPAVAGKT